MTSGLRKLQRANANRSVLPIKDVLEHYGAKIPDRNGWSSIRCPFHDDTHKSATVNIRENVFCCFACQIKGDTYRIIMEREGLGFNEAIKFAERISGQSIQVLRSRNTRSRGLPRRTGDYFGDSEESGIGRRARPNNRA